jgi:hypothetical protein
MAIEIRRRWAGDLIRTVKAETLKGIDLSDANLSDANLSDANLSDANLSRADLSGANLSRANLSRADLSGANLSRANLSRADLTGAIMPGFPGQTAPESLAAAARLTRDWLAGDHWLKGSWIRTPTAAYAGDCLACLHGAARYVGGPVWGPRLSDALSERGYTISWNDAPERTLPEVLAALETFCEVGP